MKRSSTKDVHNTRINLIIAFFTFCLAVVLFNLFKIQVLSYASYSSMANDQYWGLQELPASRGDILSSDGYILAGVQSKYMVYGEPKLITDIPKTAETLAETISEFVYAEQTAESTASEDLDETRDKNKIFLDLYDKYSNLLKLDRVWVALHGGITENQKTKIEELKLKGVGFEEEPARFYPENTLAAHVLGFVGKNEEGESQGYYGIEGNFNEELKGRAGKIVEEKDAFGTPILIGGHKRIPSIEGRDIVLTINRSIQYMVEKELKRGVEEYDAVSGTVIIMDPNTGEIIALANYPTYYPESYNKEAVDLEISPHRKSLERRNLAIAQMYEPGSVMKPFTVAAAIDLNMVTKDTTFEDEGPVWYSEKKIDNWDGKHHGTQTIVQLLQKSNNIGAAWVGHQVGPKNMSKYLTNFGFGSKTKIELEGEDSGVLRAYRDWTDIDLANISFGQGISATPLQVLTGFNALANGGHLLQPKIISKIIDNGKEIVIPTKIVRQVVSKETSEIMTDMLEKAASGGEATYYVSKKYRIAGKTGTAQIYVDGAYDPTKTNATFAGYLIADRKFSMIVKLEEPRAKIFASETAVPLWMDITDELVKFYGITPDRFEEAAVNSN
ncbi:hypothetical protein A2415_04720 [candidate division WWE3 bacterium RIFOXYC1_FULL_39_7]|uniref:Penicillin-binding protein 2 n=2 Tax=Katanobacteria TaxID=422282 RepID=A0A1F4X6J8_UNCKA|nr:MAG: hypothetical protein A2415_04720 [candidate division WWE3 bacterium RIFOXYC1_FULL_39_7]OGC77304.1 MAG: hypothetical protein A2619_04680 [candidate division WWE3 bacterium RIFOXYD1_FULL_39_9]